MKRIVITICLMSGILLSTTGCESDAGNTGLLGAALGVGVGALTGGDSGDLLTGALIGGGAGYIVGNESDKAKARQATNAELARMRAENNSVDVWITNSNGSKKPVRLHKSGPNYIGPRGEYYPSMPTNEDLRMVYGF